MKRTPTVAALVTVAILAGGVGISRHKAIRLAEKNLMVHHDNGPQTPETFGVNSRQFRFQSGARSLAASVVHAPTSCSGSATVLIFHGRGETISQWARAQAFLSQQCVSSMVFDYAGHGSSTGEAHIPTLNDDAMAAYATFVQHFPADRRRCVLAHSMGNAPMLHGFGSFSPKPDCTVSASAFSSVQDYALAGGAPKPFAVLLRGIWDNTDAIAKVTGPLLIIHSDADEVVPHPMAQTLSAAAPAGAQQVVVKGLGHNAMYEAPSTTIWGPIVTFLHGGAN